MDIIGFLLVVAFFMSLVVIERQNVEMKASLKRIEEKLDKTSEEK